MTMESETKQCQNCKRDFIVESEDFAFYEKVKVPPPTFCPQCRLMRRLAFRNEKSLYRRTCDKCNKNIISVFPQDAGFTVYCSPCWWSDDWDPLQYGKEYDPSRPFIVQFMELLKKTPMMALFGYYKTLENSDYTNMVGNLKNCYLLTNSGQDENCSYGSDIISSKESVDNKMLTHGELCYETVNCRECYKTLYSLDCESCSDVYFSKNCVGCSYLIGCVNLRNKSYCIFNTQYTKEEYQEIASQYVKNSYVAMETVKQKAFNFWNSFPQKYTHERRNKNVTGDYLYNSKNVKDSFVITDTENSRYCSLIVVGKVSDSYDFTHYGENCDLMYEVLQAGDQVSRIFFSWFAVQQSYNIEYSAFIVGGKNIFGSVALQKKENCILNKHYSKEDYEKLRLQIIEDMNKNPYRDSQGHVFRYGEFFPIECSPFGYNATTAQEEFPLTKEEAINQGYQWKEQEKIEYKITVTSDQLPDSSAEASDDIVKEIIACAHNVQCNHQCSGAFKITSAELMFYKRMNLPLPRLCPNCRHFARMKFRNPFNSWHRTCMCNGLKSEQSAYQNTVQHFHKEEACPNEFETSYAPDRPEIVYCEQCYNAEVV